MPSLPAGLSELERWAVFLSALAAGLLAAGALLRMLVRLIQRTRAKAREVLARAAALERLVQHELQPNSGGTLYDKVTEIQRQHEQTSEAVHLNSRRLDDLEEQSGKMANSLSTLAEAQAAIWPAIEAVARAEPPRNPDRKDAAP